MKRTSYWMAGLVALGLLTTSALAQAIGTVVGIEGLASLVRGGTELPVALRTRIELNDRILTRGGTRVEVLFDDDSILAVGEKSEVTIDTYVYDPSRKDESQFGAQLGKGIFRLITGKITDLNPERFRVKTGRSSIGIRGCELGFVIDDASDRILLIRIPGGRNIRIGPAGRPDAEAQEFTRAGRMVTVFNGGRMVVEPIPPGGAEQIFGQTAARPAKTGNSGGTSDASGSSAPEGFAGAQDGSPGGPEPDPVDEFPMDPETEFESDLQEFALEEDAEEGIDGAPLENMETTDESAPDEDPTSEETPDPEPDPDPGPEQVNLTTANGLGGVYSGVSEQFLTEEITYRLNAGTITYDQVDGQTVAYADLQLDMEVAGANPRVETIDLGRIPLSGIDRTAGYSSYEEVNANGVRIANDNLGEFVRYIDSTDPSRALLYWGVQDETARLPDGRLVRFEVETMELPTSTLEPNPGSTRSATLIWNTRTGSWLLDFPDGTAHDGYGHGELLQVFGSAAQGVGGVQPATLGGVNPPTQGPGMNPGRGALAGFRVDEEPAAAPTGTRTLYGYAAGVDMPPQGGSIVRYLSSANGAADPSAALGGQVRIGIDRDVMVDSLSIDLRVSTDPLRTSPDPNDLTVSGNPTVGHYVQDDRFQGSFSAPGQQVNITANGNGGEGWVWGEWAGQHEVDFGTGPLAQYTEGFWAAGDVVPEAAFQALVSGAQAYRLQTPADRPGVAAAKVGDANYFTTLLGTANLAVDLPGNSSTPTWSGTFSQLTDGKGNSLDMTVGGGFNAGGRMQGSAANYTLVLPGGTRNAGLIRNEITGNLVGSGVAPQPIHGAIGEGALDFSDGTRVRLVFGTDLAPATVQAAP